MRTFCIMVAALAAVSTSRAQTGVNDDRVSLPEGPGSLEGIGDNASVNPNMGSMTFDIPIAVPEGFAGVTPSLSLAYSSAAPVGVSGIGWDLAVPYIERMTNLGLPEYDIEDDFVANGGDQLVPVAQRPGGILEFRARFERGFSRYRWHDFAQGQGGYWTEETPDGITRYYGANAAGEPVDDALSFGRGGATFRWQLVEVVDPFGHSARYSYQILGGLPHLDRIQYIFTAGDVGAEVRLDYAPREDRISDARSGRNEVRTHRLSGIDVRSKGTRIWRYDLTYEPYRDSGGLSRLQRVERTGLEGEPYPVVFDFEYSRTLGAICDMGCEEPYLVDMGSIGVNLGSGEATLVDLNGDALPDIVDSASPGAHRIFINTFNGRDDHVFSPVRRSDGGTQAGHQISSPYVQTLDVNGDGRADLVNVRTGQVLYNLGVGDWSDAEAVDDVDVLPDFGEEFAVGAEELTHVRFFDFDNDRRIDVLRSTDINTDIYRNVGSAGFVLINDVEHIGVGFADARLEMADLNGDGLLDPVLVRPGAVRYRINLGRGEWSNWREIGQLPFNDAQIDFVELEDINGDSLDDIVIVQADRIQYALNRGGDRFDAVVQIDAAGGRALPQRVDGTTVLYADMNGSGSDDVVWITAAGDVTYLELFPLRPNLLTRITNGLGLVTEVTYATSVEMLAEADNGWAYTLPFPMLMARSIDTYDALNAVHTLTEYTYRDAYYDPVEKALRGFEFVDIERVGDASQAGSFEQQTYALGVDDPHYKGLLLSSRVFAIDGDARQPMAETRTTYAECPVAGVGAIDGPWAVRSICPVARETVVQEQADADDWVTTREEFTYDGQGNVILEARLGAVAGAICGACDRPEGLFGAPCGEGCEGDEQYTWTEYAEPSADGRWLLRLPVLERVSADPDGRGASETRYYYDGAPFLGLAAGEFTAGLLSRRTRAVDGARVIAAERNRFNAHGRVIESIQPRGDLDRRGHRIFTLYDDEQLLITQSDYELLGPDGQPYRVRRDYTYDDAWGQVASATNWQVRRGAQTLTSRALTEFTYDAIGRVNRIARPGDAIETPTDAYVYEAGDPVSRILVRRRSRLGALLPDVEQVLCYDGFGRQYQARNRIAGGPFEVDQFVVRNRRGEVVQRHRPHRADAAACALSPPDAPPITTRNDASGRVLVEQLPDAAVHGTPSENRWIYGPLETLEFTADDLDPDAPFANTPVRRRVDGLGRLTAFEYVNADGTAGPTWRLFYDARGAFAALEDPAGNLRAQETDRAGRVVRVEDPNRGVLRFEYDDAGNLVRREDAEGRVVHSRFDSVQRLVARWSGDDVDGTGMTFTYDDPRACRDPDCDFTGGQLVHETFPRGERWFTYDNRGRKITETVALDGVALTTRWTYDNLDRVLAVTLPDGTQIDQRHDATGRIVAIPGVLDAVRYARGQLPEALEFANGVTARWQYDVLDRPTMLAADGPTPVLDLTYDYTRHGRLSQVTDGAPGGGPGQAMRVGYDLLDRLAFAELDPERPDFAERIDYAYDAIDNLIRRTSSRGVASPAHIGELAYGEAGPNIPSQAGAIALSHDAAGFLTEKGETALTWDGFGRLVGAAVDGEPVWSAAPGPRNTRVIVEEGARLNWLVNEHFEIEDGMALTRVALGSTQIATIETDTLAATVLPDLNDDDAISAADAMLTARLEADAQVASPRRVLRASVRGLLLEGAPRVVFHHHDRHGNLIATTDVDGGIVERTAWYPHGGARGPATATGWGYDGKQTDRSLGMTFYGSRYFDPAIGQWIAPDFAFDQLGSLGLSRPREASNGYLYMFHNPLAYDDLEGNQGKPTATTVQPRSAYAQVLVERANARAFRAEAAVEFAESGLQGALSRINAQKTLAGHGMTRELANALDGQAKPWRELVGIAKRELEDATQAIIDNVNASERGGDLTAFGLADGARAVSAARTSDAARVATSTTALSESKGAGLAGVSRRVNKQSRARRKGGRLSRLRKRLGRKKTVTAVKSKKGAQ